MFSARMKGRLTGLALAGALLAMPAAAMAGVVVKSTGPSSGQYPVGTQVEDGSSITLREGDKITVLTSDGTRVMQGPGTFQVGEGATRTRARFSDLTRRRAARRVRTGAVRGESGLPIRSPNLWYVNVGAQGTVCLADLAAVRLWRPSSEGEQTFEITQTSTRNSTEITFTETEAVRALDTRNFAIEAGASYTISEAGSSESANTVTFVALEGEFAQEEQLAQALIGAGCTDQLALLADTLEETAESR